MTETIATATEMKNNFGHYLNIIMGGHEVIITKNGKVIGRFIPQEKAVSFLSDSLNGILKGKYDEKELRGERLAKKYESTD